LQIGRGRAELCRGRSRATAWANYNYLLRFYYRTEISGSKKSGMKVASEYLADAAKFERLARAEQDPNLKVQLEKQAAAYRKLAHERAKKLGMPLFRDPPEAA
jgi:hypothetical protein